LSQSKGNKIVQDKFYELFSIRKRFDDLKKQRATLKSQIDQYYSIDSFGMVSHELAERDLCIVDSAFVASGRSRAVPRLDSNVLFVNHTASQLMIGKNESRMVDLSE
jgi:hypothetical protein